MLPRREIEHNSNVMYAFAVNISTTQELQNLKESDASDGKSATQAAMIGGELSSSDGKLATWQRRILRIWRWRCSSKSIDRFSRRFFPTFFILFNVIYWTYYLTPPHYHCNISTKTEGGCSIIEVEEKWNERQPTTNTRLYVAESLICMWCCTARTDRSRQALPLLIGLINKRDMTKKA